MEKTYTCSPKCPYFSSPEYPQWEWNEKRKCKVSKNSDFVCLYDGHNITDWYDNICPRNKI